MSLKIKRGQYARKLDPNESAMDNLWRLAYTACRIILKMKNLTLYTDEYTELLDDLAYLTVRQFMEHRIGQKKYSRQHTFFQNVYACAYSSTGSYLKRYLARLKIKIAAIDIDSAAPDDGEGRDSKRTLGETLDEASMAPLRNYKASYNHGIDKKKNPDECLSRWGWEKAVREEYDFYCVQCEGMGVTPVSFDRYILVNGYIEPLV